MYNQNQLHSTSKGQYHHQDNCRHHSHHCNHHHMQLNLRYNHHHRHMHLHQHIQYNQCSSMLTLHMYSHSLSNSHNLCRHKIRRHRHTLQHLTIPNDPPVHAPRASPQAQREETRRLPLCALVTESDAGGSNAGSGHGLPAARRRARASPQAQSRGSTATASARQRRARNSWTRGGHGGRLLICFGRTERTAIRFGVQGKA